MAEFVSLAGHLAWPLVILILVLRFSGELTSLLNRLRTAGKEGLGFDPASPSATSASSPLTSPLTENEKNLDSQKAGPEGQTLAPREHIPAIYLPLYDQSVARVKDVIPTFQKRFSGSTDEILIAIVADLMGSLALERASRHMFRSQVTALEALKWQTEKLTKSEFRPFYEAAAKSNPSIYENYTFDQWFNFLVAVDLVSLGADDVVHITEAGKVVGRYLADRAYVAANA